MNYSEWQCERKKSPLTIPGIADARSARMSPKLFFFVIGVVVIAKPSTSGHKPHYNGRFPGLALSSGAKRVTW